MKTWKHINEEQRKIICSGIAHNKKLYQIADMIKLDPRSISREVKRNRTPINFAEGAKSNCNKLKRWPFVCSNCNPFVCSNCNNRYNKNCSFIKFKYDSKIAQRKADANLVNSRKGIDLDSSEFKKLDFIIKKGIDDNKSVYQIMIENKDDINKSITTLYRYINNGYLTTKRIDLPYAVKYKKRKHNKKYDYSSNNKIDRTGHTYLDYLSYIHKNPGINVWQLDFLGAIKTDSNNILSFILPNIHFTLITLINNPNSSKIVSFFDNLEQKIGTEAFIDLIPVILTDRDPNFTDIDGICFSKITGEERCKLFFCNPYVSNQKPNVENINKQLRRFFPKGKSVDNYSQKDITEKNLILLKSPLKSLDGYTPEDAFKKVYGDELFNKLFVNGER